jgi:hypothetical protein
VARCQIDSSIQRTKLAGFAFPLGVYPVQDMKPIPGFTLTFESADGSPYDDDFDDQRNPHDDPDDPDDDDDPHQNDQGEGPGGLSEADLPDEDLGPELGPRSRGTGSRSGGSRAGPKRAPGAGQGQGDRADRPSLGSGMGSGPGSGPGKGSGQGPGSRGGNTGDADETADPAEGMAQWPDRYVFDVNISATRVEALCRALFALLPGRVYPILDVMGNDAFREIDPYIAYDLVGIERFYDGLRRFRPWLYEDGLVGFGAMSEDPFFYVFVDEHKIVTVRAEAHMKEQVEQLLAAFDLREVDKIAGADDARHEHRSVLDQDALSDRPDLLAHDEIVEELRDLWGLTLNVDPVRNLDDDGHELGITYWRCIVRVLADEGNMRYAEALLSADGLQTAGDLACSAVEQLDPALSPDTPPDDQEPSELDVLVADRLREDQVRELLGEQAKMGFDLTANQIIAARWLE